MNSVDKISKEAKNIFDTAKDNAVTSVISAVKNGLVDVDEAQLPKLVQVLTLSFEESMQRALPHFQNSIRGFASK